MKSTTFLDSVVFQLTPTRTRCDLVITASGKREKIASGLLNPFLAHLKTAQDQIGKGGYSIVLEPKKRSDASWFTKGTVERFVRFVRSPDILERVHTVELEIIQIQKAISLQNNDNGSHKVIDLPVKPEERLEGSKNGPVCNGEKAIVLYHPANPQSEEDYNSKVQLVQVLKTRKSMLQKEQGMAFARAIAASFDVDNISTLLAFAECFEASRMKDACNKFLNLWKAKHESGQWVEVEETEAVPCRSDMPSTNASGIVFLGPSESQQGEIVSEKSPTGTDKIPLNPQEYSPGQFPQPMFPPWQMHPQANGVPVFQPYPMHGMPYYQNYMGQSPFFQSPYTPSDDSKLHSGGKTRQTRHSMDSRDLSAEFEAQEIDSTTDEEEPSSMKLKNKGGKSSSKQSGKVVIRNLNYITSAIQDSSDTDDDEERNIKRGEAKKLKKKGDLINSKEVRMSGQGGDSGNWQAFENFLLNDVEENNNKSTKSNMFAMEGKAHGRKRQSSIGDDSSSLGMRKSGQNHDAGMSQNLDFSEDATGMRKSRVDQMLNYGQDSIERHRDSKTDLQTMEGEGHRGAYRRSRDTNMDYMIDRRENLTDVWDPSLDPVIKNGLTGRKSDGKNKGSSNMSDESFMVLRRLGSSDQVRGDRRTTMDIDCELPSKSRTIDHTYEPNDLNLMPTRVMEDRSSGYDREMDYEMQAQNKNLIKLSGKNKEVVVESKGVRKPVKDQKLKADKRTTVSTRRPSKSSPVEDARARAEKLRAYKADLQKLKKEKEEEQRKRLEALKNERQKRIAAKSGANPSHSQQAKRQLPKLSPISQKSSKFTDSEPGSSSPLQRSKLKIISRASPDVSKVSKSGKLNNASQTNGNRLTRSTSSIRTQNENKNVPTPDSTPTISKIRRLSEPLSKSTKEKSSKISEVKVRASKTSELTFSKLTKEKSSRISEVKARAIKTTELTLSKSTKEKSSRLSEVKARATKTTESTFQRKSTKEMCRRTTDKILPTNQSSASKDSAHNVPYKNVDDNMVVEKTVLIECEKPSVSVFRNKEYKIGVRTVDFPVQSQASEEDRAVPPPASPITVKEVDREKSNCIVKGKTYTHLNESEKVLPNISTVDPHNKPYQPPYARVSSLEDPSLGKLEYVKAPPSVDIKVIGEQTTKAYVSDTQRSGPSNNDTREAYSRKHHEKESSKGFKRLLMFGKKNSTTSERTHNGSMVHDPVLKGSSSEALRPFSLLSHFRSKNSEKTLTP